MSIDPIPRIKVWTKQFGDDTGRAIHVDPQRWLAVLKNPAKGIEMRVVGWFRNRRNAKAAIRKAADALERELRRKGGR